MKHSTIHFDSDISEVLKAARSTPSVSIVLPFDTKINLKTELQHRLHVVIQKVKDELAGLYPTEDVDKVMRKLEGLAGTLNPDTGKKGIAIFVSPIFQKILYLDIPADEKIVVGNSFEIRDLVYCKKQMFRYLLLVLSYSSSRVFTGDACNLLKLTSGIPRHIDQFVNDVPERVANFSDPDERKEVLLEKFLHHIDKGLGELLNEYRIPFFIAGPKKVLGRFFYISKHADSVAGVVHGNFEEATEPELLKALDAELTSWKQIQQKELVNRLEDAAGEKRLAAGIKKVWEEASAHNGRLLLVEKGFMYPAIKSGDSIVGGAGALQSDGSVVIADAVDDIIETVLANGGDVEFVDPDMLHAYDRIALVRYY